MARGLEARAGVCESPGSRREPRGRKIRSAETLTAWAARPCLVNWELLRERWSTPSTASQQRSQSYGDQQAVYVLRTVVQKISEYRGCIITGIFWLLHVPYVLGWAPRRHHLLCAKSLPSCPTLFGPLDWAHQSPLCMGFARQEYWSGLPCPPPGDLLHPGIEPASLMSSTLAGRFFTAWHHSPWNSPGQNTGVDSLSRLQGIFSTQGLNPGLPHCKRILYHLSHQGSPRILKWVASLFSSGSSPPRNRTRFSCIASGFFTSWATREAWHHLS